MFKVGAAFAHSQFKTTTHRQFRACLQLFQRNKMEFLHKYVTTDETWIHHFTLETNWQSAKWTAADESRKKMQTLVGKVLASIFWDA